MYTSTPADVPDPPFRFFAGLAPRLDCPGGHPAHGQNVLGVNLFTTAGPLTVSLGLSLATYCGIIDDGMMTAMLAAPRDLMIWFLDR